MTSFWIRIEDVPGASRDAASNRLSRSGERRRPRRKCLPVRLDIRTIWRVHLTAGTVSLEWGRLAVGFDWPNQMKAS